MKPELKEALAKLRKIRENLSDIDQSGRLILADLQFQAEKLSEVIKEIEIHGGGTGQE